MACFPRNEVVWVGAVWTLDVEKQQVGLLFLNLDHFKNINDGLGPSVGDALLCQVAGRLRKILREADTVAHLGGDGICRVAGRPVRPR